MNNKSSDEIVKNLVVKAKKAQSIFEKYNLHKRFSEEYITFLLCFYYKHSYTFQKLYWPRTAYSLELASTTKTTNAINSVLTYERRDPGEQ